eukprot:CAMPEP_0171240438 /NCGR_PEP_ID=MMETSP0790-20130122/44509_1 /TAXON_ID=2925 /ORGANISM="Alexandrium catenella, Strain OF101" /LENGTH=338 /DNA_ID=CAMNT_0011706875 /DNA_START=1 /DNA_END=1017 /DNA_ORIENTATION=-
MAAGPSEVKIALVQAASNLGEVEANVASLERQCRKAAEGGAQIVVLPEASVTGYLSQDLSTNWHIPGRPLAPEFKAASALNPAGFAEPRDGPSTVRFAKLAAELGVYITVPFIEYDPETKQYFNAVSLVAPEGGDRSVAHYRKNCPWPFPEKSWASPGAGVDGATYDTPYGRVGLAVCFDIHSILAKYADRQLWALLNPIAWVGSVQTWFGEILPERLQEVNCPFFIFGANWATTCPESWKGAGGSTVLGPQGRVLQSALGSEGFVGKATIVYATVPTQHSQQMPQVGPLNLDAYARWTRDQPGTDYWSDLGPGAGGRSLAGDVRALRQLERERGDEA